MALSGTIWPRFRGIWASPGIEVRQLSTNSKVNQSVAMALAVLWPVLRLRERLLCGSLVVALLAAPFAGVIADLPIEPGDELVPGAVAFELEGPLREMRHCHCSRCRKHHGAPFATYVGSDISGFRYLSAEEQVRQFDSSSAWSRCFWSQISIFFISRHAR